jgi:hypothetical protein
MVVKVIDHGFKNYVDAMKVLNTKVVAVGLFANVGDSVLEKGIYNEFGTKNIPERSFLRSTFNKEHKKIARRFTQIVEGINKKDYSVMRKLKLIGVEQAGQVQQTITDMKSPPNAPSTIRKKGVDNPLIDTGEMRAKISSEVR